MRAYEVVGVQARERCGHTRKNADIMLDCERIMSSQSIVLNQSAPFVLLQLRRKSAK